MFIASLFTIARTWKLSKWLSTEEWIKTLHLHNGILIIKRNEIVPFAVTCIDLETVIQSEVRKRKTNII